MRLPKSSTYPSSPLGFRRMEVRDLPRVVAIENDGFSHPWSAELLSREMTHDWATVLLATGLPAQGGAAGEAVLGFIVYWLVHDELHVLNIAIAVEERRRGVGRALMEEAARRARAAGAVLSTLEVRRSNAGALGLYQALGYRQVGIRKNYYADEGEDAIVMVADL